MAKKQSQPLAGDLKSLIDALSDPLWIVDADGQTLWTNTAADGRAPNGRQIPLSWRGLEARLVQAPAQEMSRRLEELEEREAHAQARVRRAQEREQWAEERVARAEERRGWAEEQLARRPADDQLRRTEERLAEQLEKTRWTEERLARAEDQLASSEAQSEKLRQTEERLARAEEQLAQKSGDAARLQRAEEQARRIAQQLDETKERLKQVQKQVADQELLARLAYFDERTQLPNRNQARRQLEQLFKSRTSVALFSLDLDQFQRVRDRYGPSTGTELMKLLIRRLGEFVRTEDLLACSGLDSFLIVMPRPDDTEVGLRQSSGIQAERLLTEIARPFTVHGQRVQVKASLGISHFPGDAASADELMANAEAARGYAKEQGGGTFRVYDGEIKRSQERRAVTEEQLRQAVSAREFTVHYQPIVDLKTARTAGAEALIRWQHRLDGLLVPEQFLPSADKLGLIIAMGHQVIEDVIARLRQYALPRTFFYSLNMSHRQFLDARLGELLRPIPVDRLVVEMDARSDEDVDRALTLFKPGMRVALNQFGAEPFTFERLGTVQIVKLDRRLLRGVPEDKRAASVFLAALRLVQSLGLVPVAVGIENRVQVHFLRKHGCALGQGNFFSAPVEPGALAPFLVDKAIWKL